METHGRGLSCVAERPATQATEALIKNHIAISYNRHFRENNTSLQYRRNLRRPKKS